MPKSRWQAQHSVCQAAVDNLKADLTKEIERLTTEAEAAQQMVRHLQVILQIESDGAKAAFSGEPLTANPWPKDTTVSIENWHLWRQGWQRAEADVVGVHAVAEAKRGVDLADLVGS